MSGILPSIIYPSTVSDEQARLKAALTATNNAVASCAQLDATTRSNWTLFYGAALGFCNETPGWFGLGTMMDRVQSYETELVSWQATLGKTCTLGVPGFDPNVPNPGTQAAVQALQYVAWGLGALAGAYIVGQVISIIPKPPRA
jgi:hypothetical protein